MHQSHHLYHWSQTDLRFTICTANSQQKHGRFNFSRYSQVSERSCLSSLTQQQQGMTGERPLIELDPPPQPVVVLNPDHVQNHLKIFKMKEKVFSWSGDSFDILDENGTPFYRVRGRAFAISEKRSLHNPVTDESFGSVKSKFFSIHRKQFLYNKDDVCVAMIKVKTLLQIHANADCFLTDPQGNPRSSTPDFTISGSIFAHEYEVVNRDGLRIIKVDRKIFDTKTVFFGQENFNVYVAPGVDCSFAVFLVAALDEIFTDQNR